MYPHFETDTPRDNPDVVVEQMTMTPDPDTVLGEPTDYYGWTGDLFVIRNDTDCMAVEPSRKYL